MKLVSILIPVYNRENFIEETIKSALNQTYNNIEVIVVDNKSTDKTWSILENFSKFDNRIKIFQNDFNIGPVKNWMECIKKAHGVYGKILWSDDLISPDFLEKTVPYLSEKTVGFVFSQAKIFEESIEKGISVFNVGKTSIYNSEFFIENSLIGETFPVSPGCALFRMKDLKKNLLIDIPNKIGSDFKNHAIGNDLLIFLITASQYPKFAFISEDLSFFRNHGESITRYTDSVKLKMLYNISKAFFIERFYYKLYFLKKFNAYLLYDIVRFKKNSLKINSFDQFYFNPLSTKHINYTYFFIYITKKTLIFIKNKIVKLINMF
jgi:glycosyltransferase involved in cell wall biosynthesis